MENELASKIHYVKNKSLQDIIEDGISMTAEAGGDGFEYIIGEVDGYKVKVSIESPKCVSSICEFDGVNGFAYSLLCEKEQANDK